MRPSPGAAIQIRGEVEVTSPARPISRVAAFFFCYFSTLGGELLGEMQDTELLRDYVTSGSEPAFAELVKRYVDFVHSTASRQLAGTDAAEEVTQAVFCLLARKAGGLTHLPTLGGWLYRTTCFTAAKARRAEHRRRLREHEAARMNVNEPGNDPWESLSPLLDEGLNQLGETDRIAVLLRFFQQKPMREVGETIGISEAAAKMRVGRSLDRLRDFFAKRGVACTASALATLLAERSVKAAPSSLSGNITRASLAGASAAATSAAVLGLKLFAGFTLKTAAATAIAVLALLTLGIHTYRYAHRLPVAKTQTVAVAAANDGSSKSSALSSQKNPVARLAENSADLNQELARLRAAIHATNQSDCPGFEVVEIVKRLRPHTKTVFVFLKGEAADFDPAAISCGTNTGVSTENIDSRGNPLPIESIIAPQRAFYAMGFLDKSVPEVPQYLWSVYHASPSKGIGTKAYAALGCLGNLGFDVADISVLANTVLTETNLMDVMNEAYPTSCDGFIKSQAAQWIAQTIKKYPFGAKPYIPAVENLLSSANPDARFWAAGALLQSEGATNAKVPAEIIDGLRHPVEDRLFWAGNLLKDAGAAAAPFGPALLDAARATDDDALRKQLLLAAGTVAPDLRHDSLDVDEVVQADEKDKAWMNKLNSGTAGYDDLVPELKNTNNAWVAAEMLGRMGSAASNALPQMVEALNRQTEDGNIGTILEAMRQIDPQSALSVKDSLYVMMTVVGKDPIPETNGEDRINVFELFLQSRTWCTRIGIQKFAAALNTRDPKAYQTFKTAVLEKNPEWTNLPGRRPHPITIPIIYSAPAKIPPTPPTPSPSRQKFSMTQTPCP